MATELGELVVKISGNVKDFETAMAAVQKATEQAMAQVSASVDKAMGRVRDTLSGAAASVKQGIANTNAEFAKIAEVATPKLLQVGGALAGITTIAYGATEGLGKLRSELEKMPKGEFEDLKHGLDQVLGVLQPVVLGLAGVSGAVTALGVALPLLATPAGLVAGALAAITAAAAAMYVSLQNSMDAVKGADPQFRNLGNSINYSKEKLEELNKKLDEAEQKQALKEIGSKIKVDVVTDAEKQKAAMEELEKQRKRAEQGWMDFRDRMDETAKFWETASSRMNASSSALVLSNANLAKTFKDAEEAIHAAALEQIQIVDVLPKVTDEAGRTTHAMWIYNDAQMAAARGAMDLASMTSRGMKDVSEAWRNAATAIGEYNMSQTQAAEIAKRNIEWGRAVGKGQADAAKEGLKEQSELGREVSTIMSDLNRQLARAIIHWNGFKEAGLNALEAIGEAILRMVIKNLIEASGIVEKLSKKLGDLLGKIPGLGGIFGGGKGGTSTGGSIPGVGGGGGGAIGSAVSEGLTGIVGAVSGVVSAVSGVIGNFQFMAMNKSLDLIEHNTRYAMIHLEYLLEKANETWPYLKHINDTLWTPGAPGGGGGTQITVNYTGDVRSLAMMLLSELQRMGLRVSPA